MITWARGEAYRLAIRAIEGAARYSSDVIKYAPDSDWYGPTRGHTSIGGIGDHTGTRYFAVAYTWLSGNILRIETVSGNHDTQRLFDRTRHYVYFEQQWRPVDDHTDQRVRDAFEAERVMHALEVA